MAKFKPYVLLFSIVVALNCCNKTSNNVDRAFYYWKTGFALSDTDKSYLRAIGVNKLYLHFFDVVWNDDTHLAVPTAKMYFKTSAPGRFQYTPVIFIANKVLEKTITDSIGPLCHHILNETNRISNAADIGYKELQIDCDWTETTRDKYFNLLGQLSKVLHKSGVLISATIRLHQIKYANITGVPPVDRGMLMFYNMGKLNAKPGYNSIYSTIDANKYAAYIKDYKLMLDVALPVFSWAVCIHQGAPNGIIEKATCNDFADTAQFTAAGNNIFVSRNSFFLHSRYFIKNDTVKIEQITPEICEDAASNVSKYMSGKNYTVSLFEYDSLYISTYTKNDFEKIYSTFSN